MKAAVILSAAGLVAAQNLSGAPDCAVSCITSAVTAAGCQATDTACACGSSADAVSSLAAPCLIKACDAAELVSAQSVGSKLCASTAASTTATATATATGTDSGSVTGSASSGPAVTGPSVTGTGFGTGTVIGTGTGTGSIPTPGSNTTFTSGKPSTSAANPTSDSGSQPTTSNPAVAATPMAFGALAVLMGAVAAL